jgi:hypothetical protein
MLEVWTLAEPIDETGEGDLKGLLKAGGLAATFILRKPGFTGGGAW